MKDSKYKDYTKIFFAGEFDFLLCMTYDTHYLVYGRLVVQGKDLCFRGGFGCKNN